MAPEKFFNLHPLRLLLTQSGTKFMFSEPEQADTEYSVIDGCLIHRGNHPPYMHIHLPLTWQFKCSALKRHSNVMKLSS